MVPFPWNPLICERELYGSLTQPFCTQPNCEQALYEITMSSTSILEQCILLFVLGAQKQN
jgi:hypothetical protein